MIQERDDIVALDSAIIQHPRTWEASGHLAGFTDPLIDCRTCKQRFRADHLEEERAGSASHPEVRCGRAPSKLPGDHPDCDLTEAREFNLMFETTIGPVKDAGSTVYLRPETAQGIFLAFKTTLQYARRKPPFGIAQIGKSFRNEITPGNFIFRTLEFEQMEMEFFVPPAEAESWHEHWMQARMDWYAGLGLDPERLRLRAHGPDELSHYSSATSDIEYLLPDRLVRARGHRQPRRLRPHPAREVLGREARVRRHRHPGALRPARDRAGGRRRRARSSRCSATPTTRRRSRAGRARCCACTRRSRPSRWPCCRSSTATACPSWRASSTRGCARRSPPSTTRAARSAGATAARTRSARPGAITVDGQTTEDRTVTLRDRDSLEQVRVPMDDVADELAGRLAAPWRSPRLDA